jgi:hypothetical protein
MRNVASIKTRAVGVTEATDAPLIVSGLHREVRYRVGGYAYLDLREAIIFGERRTDIRCIAWSRIYRATSSLR